MMDAAEEAWARTRGSHAGLSQVDVRFREHALRDSELLAGAGANGPEEQALVRARQPWPLFVSARRLRGMAEAAVAVSGLVRSIPEKIFRNDAARMAAFYGWSEGVLRAGLRPPNAIAEGLSRGDFIDSESGFKCAEFNFGGNLGGTDNGVVARMVLSTPAIRRFIAGLGTPVRYRDSFRLLARYVVRQALASRLSRGEVNAAILVLSYEVPQDAPLGMVYKDQYESVLAGTSRPLRGRLFLCGKEGLTVEDGALHYRGTRLHIVVEGDTSMSDPLVVECFKAGTLHLYNGPTAGVLSDKRNLALLSAHADSEAFTAAERAAIERHIPWSRLLVPGETVRDGERRDIAELALAGREGLVLKKAISLGGKDVHLGRETAPAEWERVVRQGLGEGSWLLQEHVESRHYLFQHGDGCRVHRAVWGPYVFGSEYGGMHLRVQPEEYGGVVNGSRGAYRATVFEVEDDPADDRRDVG
jgi:hypothetical protein